MLGFDHHSDAVWMQMLPDALRDLRGETLLDLQPSRKTIEHTRKLGNADDTLVWHISNRRFAGDRCHMVFAMRLKRNVFEQDEFVIAPNFLKRSGEVMSRVLTVA